MEDPSCQSGFSMKNYFHGSGFFLYFVELCQISLKMKKIKNYVMSWFGKAVTMNFLLSHLNSSQLSSRLIEVWLCVHKRKKKTIKAIGSSFGTKSFIHLKDLCKLIAAC